MKKTIKIIDLYNMISKGSIPKKIKYNTKIYEYDKNQDDYSTFLISHYDYLLDNINITSQLNDEVEILDEVEFEDIEEIETSFGGDCKHRIFESNGVSYEVSPTLKNKINQLIKNQKKIIERVMNNENKNN